MVAFSAMRDWIEHELAAGKTIWQLAAEMQQVFTA